MKILIIGHNQLNGIKRQIEIIKATSFVQDEDFIVVDNYSDDGTKDWLVSQHEMDFVICDERMENVAAILNLVINEFTKEEDILFVKPGMILLPGCLAVLAQIMDSNTSVGAVFPGMLCKKHNGITYSTDEGFDIAQANFSENAIQKLGIDNRVVLLNGKMLNSVEGLDESISLSHNIFTDLSFKAIVHDYLCLEASGVYAMSIFDDVDLYNNDDEAADKSYLRDNWGMNYFNEIPNENMLSFIKEKQDAEISVLEIGCDCGANLLWIKNRYKNAKIFGVEINPVSARIASHLFSVVACDIEKMEKPFADEKFDYIIFGDVLEHLRNPEQVVSFCKEMLKPEGKILASIPNLMHYSVMYGLINGDFHYTSTGLLDRTHIHFFTYNEIVRMFSGEGYDIKDLNYVVVGDNAEHKEAVIKSLMSISEDAKHFMFEAFQYIVLAQVKNS